LVSMQIQQIQQQAPPDAHALAAPPRIVSQLKRRKSCIDFALAQYCSHEGSKPPALPEFVAVALLDLLPTCGGAWMAATLSHTAPPWPACAVCTFGERRK